MSYAMNGGMWNTQAWNGPSALATLAADLKILYNQRTIDLNWTGVDEAIYYTVQVSLFSDFRSFIVNTNIQESDYSFTDNSTDDMKRYWRWRPSLAAGAGYIEPWSEVGSYWLDTGAAEEVEVPRNYWCIIDPDDVTDRY